MTIPYYLIIISTILTYPLTHVLFKKGMMLDNKLTIKKRNIINKFFYIPFINVVITFSYLVWSVIFYKNPN